MFPEVLPSNTFRFFIIPTITLQNLYHPEQTAQLPEVLSDICVLFISEAPPMTLS
jgi:hypothetical protein